MRQYRSIGEAEDNKLMLHHVDIGETGSWGEPVETADKSAFPKFSAEIFSILGDSVKDIDTVFRWTIFRVACVLKSILELYTTKDLIIMVHDFWNREEYHAVLNYLETI